MSFDPHKKIRAGDLLTTLHDVKGVTFILLALSDREDDDDRFSEAGSILLLGEVVRGLTTAASLWTVAAIGLAVGGGLYIAQRSIQRRSRRGCEMQESRGGSGRSNAMSAEIIDLKNY